MLFDAERRASRKTPQRLPAVRRQPKDIPPALIVHAKPGAILAGGEGDNHDQG